MDASRIVLMTRIRPGDLVTVDTRYYPCPGPGLGLVIAVPRHLDPHYDAAAIPPAERRDGVLVLWMQLPRPGHYRYNVGSDNLEVVRSTYLAALDGMGGMFP